ncbi:alpha-glucuronidase, partial [Streptomyces sp. NPDC058286]
MTVPGGIDPAWLPDEALRGIGSRRVLIEGGGPLVDTLRAEVAYAQGKFGTLPGDGDVAFRLDGAADTGPEGFTLARSGGHTTVTAAAPAGLLYGFFHVVRLGAAAFADAPEQTHRPALSRRMLNHWDNIDVHPVMGQVERGYAGGSLFWEDGRARGDLDRIRTYARLLAACGINAVCVNNVNVHETEARLLGDRIGEVAAIAGELRKYGIRTHLSVSFAAPVVLDGLDTADPLDDSVRDWWRTAADRVYAHIPDFGGFVVKADSEGQPGPFAYGRSHADGANLIADALAPHGGTVHWRAFVYNHTQDWR